MNQKFHRPTKTKKKRNRSVSPGSSNLRNLKRRATPLEVSDSPLARLFNDVGIKVLVIKLSVTTIKNGKKFLSSLQRTLSKDSPEECAKDIYEKARQVWVYQQRLLYECILTIEKEPCFSDTLVAHSNNDAPEQRMASMMKDPWLDYVMGRQSSDADIRGFLSILIAYWNMKYILDKNDVSDFGRRYIIPKGGKYEFLLYAVDHFLDFQNLKEVLDSKYGSDPGLVGCLFQLISDFQVNGMNLAAKWESGRRSMIQVVLLSIDSGPPSLCKSFSFWKIPYHELRTI